MSCLQESTHEFILKLIRLETADPNKAENDSSRQPGKTQKNAQRNWKCKMISNTINRTNIAQTVPSEVWKAFLHELPHAKGEPARFFCL
jgi:hypothetical protein